MMNQLKRLQDLCLAIAIIAGTATIFLVALIIYQLKHP
jgi:hypothetical protein